MRPSIQVVLAVTLTGFVIATGTTPVLAASLNVSSTGDTMHRVRSGETLTTIARRYSVSVGSLVEANRLHSSRTRLRAGAELAIPVAVRRAVRREPVVAQHRSRHVVHAAVGHRAVARHTPSAPSAVAASAPRVKRAALRATVPGNLALTVPDFASIAPAFQWPIEGMISSAFGHRHRGWHRGLDIVAPPGAPIFAAAAGEVIASDVEDLYGRVVKIAHENGFVTVYAHNERNLVDIGEWVTAGQEIGLVGRTGDATAEHVHFEIRHDGVAYNPLYLLPLPPRVAPISPVTSDDVETSEDE